jgi:hypothetical protein
MLLQFIYPVLVVEVAQDQVVVVHPHVEVVAAAGAFKVLLLFLLFPVLFMQLQ